MIPVVPLKDRDYDEREASEVCEQRDLDFSRIYPHHYDPVFVFELVTTTPFYIVCIIEIQGLSVPSQYSKSFITILAIVTPMVYYEIILHL